MSLPAISKHLKVLELAGLVSKRREAQTRPCTLNGAPLREAEAWLQQYRRFFEASLDRLEDQLRRLSESRSNDESTDEGK